MPALWDFADRMTKQEDSLMEYMFRDLRADEVSVRVAQVGT